jgi:hypothetical protein
MATAKADKEVLEFIEKLSTKKIKEKYILIQKFDEFMFPAKGQPTIVSRESLSLLLDGDFSKKLVGLCQVCGK